MEIINKMVNNVPVTIIKTNKFKSVSVALYFKSPVTKKNMTDRTVLRSILIESCMKYNTSEKLYMNSLENYDATYSSSSSRYGNYIINSFKVTTLIDKYTKEGNLKNVIDTFCEIIFNPFVNDSGFDKDTFNLIVDQKKTELDQIKEESDSYADYMLCKSLNQKKAYSYFLEKKYLDEMTPESLYEEYQAIINNSEVSLIICGDVDSDLIIDKITSKISDNKHFNSSLIISNDDEDTTFKSVVNKGVGTQSILNIIMYLKNVSDYELNYVAPIYRVILGGATSSRLFNTIREKNSLAYYSFARLEKDDSLINVIMGIEKENYEKALDMSIKIIDGMKNVTEKEVLEAKKEITSALIESQDSIGNVISRQYNADLFGLPNIEEFIQKINLVTKKEVEELALKIKPSMSHFLEGKHTNG